VSLRETQFYSVVNKQITHIRIQQLQEIASSDIL
jgi:hypothetical protein